MTRTGARFSPTDRIRIVGRLRESQRVAGAMIGDRSVPIPYDAASVSSNLDACDMTCALFSPIRLPEAIVSEGKADMVAMARAFLDDPHWGWHAAHALGAEVARPKQYLRAAPKMWPGAG